VVTTGLPPGVGTCEDGWIVEPGNSPSMNATISLSIEPVLTVVAPVWTKRTTFSPTATVAAVTVRRRRVSR